MYPSTVASSNSVLVLVQPPAHRSATVRCPAVLRMTSGRLYPDAIITSPRTGKTLNLSVPEAELYVPGLGARIKAGNGTVQFTLAELRRLARAHVKFVKARARSHRRIADKLANDPLRLSGSRESRGSRYDSRHR